MIKAGSFITCDVLLNKQAGSQIDSASLIGPLALTGPTLEDTIRRCPGL